MRNITTAVVDGDKVVYYNGKHIKTFSKYDDYAFTNGNAYADKLRRMTDDEFKELYPEFFL